jgi:hypothetical protein
MSCRRLSQCAYYDVAPSPASSMALGPKLIGARWNGSRDMETAGRCTRAATRLPGAPTSRHIASLASPRLAITRCQTQLQRARGPVRRRPTPLRPQLLAQRCPRFHPIQAAPGSTIQRPTATCTFTFTHNPPRTPPATPHTTLLLMTARP